MGQEGWWYIGGTLRGGKMQGDDIIFPNLDMCLITLASWFGKSLGYCVVSGTSNSPIWVTNPESSY